MPSEKQLTANKQNALKGGVKTKEGKAVSRYNSIKHGIFLQCITIDEKPLYKARFQSLINEFEPGTEMEYFLIERTAFLILQIERVSRAELPDIIKANDSGNDYQDYYSDLFAEGFYTRFEDGNLKSGKFGVYQRYQTNLENRLFRLLGQLERLQKARQGEPIPQPVRLDITTGE